MLTITTIFFLTNNVCSPGNLQTYLRERREMPTYERPFDLVVPSMYDLVQFSFQAARGMEYLASRKVRLCDVDAVLSWVSLLCDCVIIGLWTRLN